VYNSFTLASNGTSADNVTN